MVSVATITVDMGDDVTETLEALYVASRGSYLFSPGESIGNRLEAFTTWLVRAVVDIGSTTHLDPKNRCNNEHLLLQQMADLELDISLQAMLFKKIRTTLVNRLMQGIHLINDTSNPSRIVFLDQDTKVVKEDKFIHSKVTVRVEYDNE